MAKRTYTEIQILKTLRIKSVTLKTLEEEEIIIPRRRKGQRIYDMEQVAEIIFAIDLYREMGVNWAGVEVALQMRRNMKKMERQMEEICKYLRNQVLCELEQEEDSSE